MKRMSGKSARARKGVRGIRLRKGDEVVAAEVAEERPPILTWLRMVLARGQR